MGRVKQAVLLKKSIVIPKILECPLVWNSQSARWSHALRSEGC